MAGMRTVNNEYRLRQNIKIAMLYLEDDDPVNAELFIKKASSLITSCKVCLLEKDHLAGFSSTLIRLLLP